jgi:hypothetical protein
MKALRLLLTAGLLAGAVSLSSAKEAKPKSYTLHGFCLKGKPSEELVQQAAKAVEARMAGMTLVSLPENADHNVEILFQKDSFEIYVDALPFAGKRVGTAPDLSLRTVPIDYAVEAAHAARTGNAYP